MPNDCVKAMQVLQEQWPRASSLTTKGVKGPLVGESRGAREKLLTKQVEAQQFLYNYLP